MDRWPVRAYIPTRPLAIDHAVSTYPPPPPNLEGVKSCPPMNERGTLKKHRKTRSFKSLTPKHCKRMSFRSGGSGRLEKDVWDLQAKSGSSVSCRFPGKIAVPEMSGKPPGRPRHPSSRHRGLLVRRIAI